MNSTLPILSGALSAAASRAIVAQHPDAVSGQADETASVNALLPEGAVFSIWGPIYLGLMGLTVAQAAPSLSSELRSARPWLLVTPPLHAAWYATVASGQGSLASMLVQTVMFGVSLKLHQSLQPLNRADADRLHRLLFAAGGLYTGWLGAANLPGWSAAALESGWDGENPSPQVWGTAGVTLGAAAGAVMSAKLDNPWVEVSFVNALAGIAVRQWKQERPVVAAVAGACAVIGGARVVRRLWQRRARRRRVTEETSDR